MRTLSGRVVTRGQGILVSGKHVSRGRTVRGTRGRFTVCHGHRVSLLRDSFSGRVGELGSGGSGGPGWSAAFTFRIDIL